MNGERPLRRGDAVVLATHNPGKIDELREPLERAGLVVADARQLGLAAPAETGESFAENASLKARAAAQAAGMAALADDSGFAVASLGGAPGILSARWVQAEGSEESAMRRVQREASGHADRRASFHCVLALARPDGETSLFEGVVQGIWVWPPRGLSGFGYDPMFQPDGDARSFGDMTKAEKQAMSHRARALRSLLESVRT